MFSNTLMSKGENKSGLDATTEDPSRIVYSFKVSINSKGGDCWHVYRQIFLVIHGKNIDGKQEDETHGIRFRG
jgi:hypothetical protein